MRSRGAPRTEPSATAFIHGVDGGTAGRRDSRARRRPRRGPVIASEQQDRVVNIAQKALTDFRETYRQARERADKFKERYREAQARAEEFREGGFDTIGAETSFSNSTEIEDVELTEPERCLYAADAAKIADVLGMPQLLRVHLRLRSAMDLSLIPIGLSLRRRLEEDDDALAEDICELVLRAGFRHFKSDELVTWSQLPRYPDGISIALEPKEGIPLPLEGRSIGEFRENALFPTGLAFCRGVDVQRQAGALLQQKLLALANSLLGWLESPLNYVILKVLELRARARNREQEERGADVLIRRTLSQRYPFVKPGAGRPTRRVRRVTVPDRWKGGWQELQNFFLPTVTQEPTVGRFLVMNYDPEVDTAQPRQLKLVIYENVPFAGVLAFIPNGVLLPNTFDAVRFDLLTIFGLISAVAALIGPGADRNALIIAGATIVRYVVRVAFNVRTTLERYERRRSRLRLRSVLARGDAALLVLLDLVRSVELKAALLLLGALSGRAQPWVSTEDLQYTIDSTLQDALEESVDLSLALSRALELLTEQEYVEVEGGSVRLTAMGLAELEP